MDALEPMVLRSAKGLKVYVFVELLRTFYILAKKYTLTCHTSLVQVVNLTDNLAPDGAVVQGGIAVNVQDAHASGFARI
jgi:hypothetical protein